jgi:hypothetical protein
MSKSSLAGDTVKLFSKRKKVYIKTHMMYMLLFMVKIIDIYDKTKERD